MTESATKTQRQQPEPWLRGTHTETPALIRAVLHALELAEEDAERWCGDLTGVEVNARPSGLPSVAFQIRHIGGSMDRLLTYAEGRELTAEQLTEMARENEPAVPHVMLREFSKAIDRAGQRLRALAGADFEAERLVGRMRLQTTLGGLLVHVADHTQRHVGQMVTTAKLLRALRGEATSLKSL